MIYGWAILIIAIVMVALFAINDFAKVAFMKRFWPGTNMLR